MLFIFVSSVNAFGVSIKLDNQETFPVAVSFVNSELNKKTKVIIPAQEIKLFTADSESVFKIKAGKGSRLELDLDKIKKGTTLFVILKNQVLDILNQNCSYASMKPFRPIK